MSNDPFGDIARKEAEVRELMRQSRIEDKDQAKAIGDGIANIGVILQKEFDKLNLKMDTIIEHLQSHRGDTK